MLIKLLGKNYDILSRGDVHTVQYLCIIIGHDYAVCKQTLRHCAQPQLVCPDVSNECNKVESNANLD